MIRTSLSLAVLATLLACTESSDATLDRWATSPVDPPAGVGSGEPFVSTTEDALLLSWLERDPEAGHTLWVSTLDAEGWSERRAIASGDDFFVNWADFPSVVAGPDGSWWSHWLQRGGAGTYDYGVRVARSDDRGATWSDAWTPHEDGTPTEHGFVSLFPLEDGMGAVWLDGRRYADGPDGEPASREMTLRFRRAADGRAAGPEELLDERVCDCCQTDVALTSKGAVAVYRNRTDEEVRDIYITRMEDGVWTKGSPVHDDEWVIGGCPVNGPAVVARGDTVAVAWFTGAGDEPQVQVAFSLDAGATFEAPQRIDGGTPAGRVDLLFLPDGPALVSWIERTGGEEAEIRMRTAQPGHRVGPPATVTGTSDARASGFPRMVVLPWDPASLLLTWTEVQEEGGTLVRATKVEIPTT